MENDMKPTEVRIQDDGFGHLEAAPVNAEGCATESPVDLGPNPVDYVPERYVERAQAIFPGITIIVPT